MNLGILAIPDVRRNKYLAGALSARFDTDAFRTVPMAARKIAKSMVHEPFNGSTLSVGRSRGRYQATLGSTGASLHWAKAVVACKATEACKSPGSSARDTCWRRKVRGSGDNQRDFFGSAS